MEIVKTPKVGDEYMLSLDVIENDDGLYTCYIPELNETLYLAETALEGLEKK